MFPAALLLCGTGRVSLPPAGTPMGVALELFKRIARAEEVEQLLSCGGVFIKGRMADYVIGQTGSTVVFRGTEMLATGCMSLGDSDYTPVYAYPGLDHMIANYLILRYDERRYWQTALLAARTDRQFELQQMIEHTQCMAERPIRPRLRDRYVLVAGVNDLE